MISGCSRSAPMKQRWLQSPWKRIGGQRCAHQSRSSAHLWETMLPPEFLRLPPGLYEIDVLLDDPVFFEPFEEFFDPEIGRPSIPMETYLRMMFLRFRYRLGFETLCAEVADSLAWRRFCRIGLTEAVPHPTTLMKITTRCGEDGRSAERGASRQGGAAKVVGLDKVRADTTVVEANVAYPSDAGLLGKGVARLAKFVEKLKAAGYGSRSTFRDRTRSVARRAHASAHGCAAAATRPETRCSPSPPSWSPSPGLRSKKPRSSPRTPGARCAGPATRPRGEPRRWSTDLEETIRVLEQVIAQTHSPPPGSMPDGSNPGRLAARHRCPARSQGAARSSRRVRLQGPGPRQHRRDRARPRGHGRQPARRPTARSGHRAPVKRSWAGPSAVTADRGYGEARVDRELTASACGVGHPSKGPCRGERQSSSVEGFLPSRQVAHRIGGTHLPSQALLGMEPHPHRRHRRCTHLVRLGRARPQRHQDRRCSSRTAPRHSQRPT